MWRRCPREDTTLHAPTAVGARDPVGPVARTRSPVRQRWRLRGRGEKENPSRCGAIHRWRGTVSSARERTRTSTCRQPSAHVTSGHMPALLSEGRGTCWAFIEGANKKSLPGFGLYSRWERIFRRCPREDSNLHVLADT